MKNIKHLAFAGVLLFFANAQIWAQVQAFNCQTASDDNVITGEVFFNYGSLTSAYSTKNRTSLTVAEPVVGEMQSANYTTGLGFWSRYLLTPSAPIVLASEGDLADRISVSWTVDPLSPAPNLGFKVYRNGSFLANIDNTTFDFVDFNVIAGENYTYTIYGLNDFGLGFGGSALGFVNPNGVITGLVKTFSGNPVPGCAVTLTPTLGTALDFNGTASAFTEYQPNYPRSQFSLSAWVKIGAGNDAAGILDMGSSISKNWWMHTTPASSGKGVVVGIGVGAGNETALSAPFPAGTEDAWHYVAATYNGSSLLFYLDGELISTAVAAISADSMPLFFGKKSDGTGFFNGKLDEVRIFNKQLSQTEIQMLMDKTASGATPGLFSYWKFDEGMGAKSFNIASNKITAFLCGAAWTTDKPAVLNAGITDANGFYQIEGINYGSGKIFTARAAKNFYYNQSLEFNAVNSQRAELTDFDLSDSSTVEITAKAFDFAGNQCLLSKEGHFALNLNAGNLVLEMGGANHNFGSLGMGFHRLSFVIEQIGGGSAATVTFYKDGTLVGTNTFSGVAANFAGGTPWTLGAKRTGGVLSNYFSGLIDDVAFYNMLLPLNEIQLAANVGTDVTHTNLQNYFPLNEGSDVELVDYGLQLTGKGTVFGATWSTVAGLAKVEPHRFTPSKRLVTLNTSNTSTDQVDFTDQSTVPVSGYVRFDGTTCFQKQVEILVNGQHFLPAVYTDSTGYFVIDFEPGATAQLTPVYKNHAYFPAFWEVKNLASPVAGILFRNQTQRHISGQLAGNAICRKSIIPVDANGNATAIVKVKVETLDGCLYREIQIMEENGKFTFPKLPPLKYTVAVTEHSNNVIYDYFQLKGGKTLDLELMSDTTDFIYYSAPQIEMTVLDTNACGVSMLEQDERYETEIKVYQQYDGGVCYLDTALLRIDNLIEGEGAFDTLMTTGKLKHKFTAGFPNIIPPYQKTLTILATANEQENTISAQAVVLGKRPRLVNFTSTSPQIPLMILRDPPGDGSNATIEKGKTVCNGWSVGTTGSVTATAGIELDLGNKQQIITGTPAVGKITEIGVDNSLEIGMSVKTGATVNNSAEVCMTATETISTSGGDVIVGEDADIYVGGALNLLFGITDDLRWDTANCSFFIHPGLLVFPDKFATTFLYSHYQIKNVVIPNLELVGDTASANQWRNILQRNANLKAAANFEKNLSFDAGVTYENATTIENTKSMTFGFDVEIEASLAASIGFDIDGTGASVKLGMAMNMGVSTEFSSTTTNSQTVAYTLGDDDIGDVFTVDVLQDKAYGTPVFKTVSGQSSCPYEPNTVPHDGVEITVDKTVISNVPENDKAVFKFTLGNSSQTNSYRVYDFGLYNASNPNGAIIKVQGAGQSGSFGIGAGQSQEVIVTVERGPVEYDYDNLTMNIYSACEDEHAAALGLPTIENPEFYKAINISARFLEGCSPIDIGFPLEDWVWQAADGDTIFITLNEFNRYDADLELIRVQYRRKQGDGAWINIVEVPKAQLDNDVFKIVKWGTNDLKDGEYEIRAVTQCFGGQNAGISHVIDGRFERQPPALFGTPEPADGVLSRGDEISIRFTEPIRCDQLIQADVFNNNNVGLYDTETGKLVDATVSCQGDKIVIIPNVPNRFIEGKILRVEVNNIKDLANNVFVEKKWEFFVDRNPIRWEGGNVKVSKMKPQFVTVTRRILNEGGQATAWELEDLPTWARIFPTSGVLQPGAAEDITFEFDSSLVFGNYLDTIRINAPEGREPLTVNCRVMCPSPDWQFSSAAYPHTMNFSLKLDVEGTLSTDVEDIVAAFIDGELRGKAKVQLLPTLPPLGTQYMVFLTVYGDADDDGKPVKLEIWDASACLRYGEVIEQFDFEVDNVIGTIGTPVVLHTNSMVRRDIPLTTGWNWISFNLLHPNPALNASLASLKYPANDLIKGRSAFAEYFGSSWVGSLSAINNRNMFQFRADQLDTIQMRGALIDPASLSIPIAAGWNWIGYVPNYPLTVTQALAGLTPLNGDIIKGQTSFAQYIAGFGWLGSLQFMEPPSGYQLKISIPGTLTYPPQPQNKQEALPTLPNPQSALWAVDATQFEYSMTLIGMFEANGQNATVAGHEIGAFTASGELRGSAQAIYIEPLGLYEFFLTTFGNTSGEQLVFKLYDSATGQIQDLAEKMYFVSDLHQGSIPAPLPFTLKSSSAVEAKTAQYLEVQPNPFSDATTILFSAEHAQEVQLVICDAIGRTVLSQKISAGQGLNTFRWENTSSASAGVYFVRLETAEGTAVLRVVKK